LTNRAHAARTVTAAECRRVLHFALSQIAAAAPPDLFSWLRLYHPDYHEKLVGPMVDRVNLAWGSPRFEAVVADFLWAVSAACAVYRLGETETRAAS
jgi:hypothetical protein